MASFALNINGKTQEVDVDPNTPMPMIVAEELDTDWKDVIVEQAPLNTDIFTRQLAGGSQSIRAGWEGLRMADATARHMLIAAAAEEWKVAVDEITTDAGRLFHKASDKSMGYGEVASAAAKLAVPEEVALKDVKDFKIIGTSRKNVDGHKIVTGKPLCGLDIQGRNVDRHDRSSTCIRIEIEILRWFRSEENAWNKRCFYDQDL